MALTKRDIRAADALALKNFTAEVNALAKARCDKINAEYKAGKRLFGALHRDYPEEMLEYYYREGYTAKKALSVIWNVL